MKSSTPLDLDVLGFGSLFRPMTTKSQKGGSHDFLFQKVSASAVCSLILNCQK